MTMVRSPEQIRHDLLVLKAQSGDSEAVRGLVDLWYERLWRLAFAKLCDREAAWDVVQDAWLKILRKLHHLRQPEAFGAWVTQVVTTTAIDHLRRRQRHAEAMRAIPLRAPAPLRPQEEPSVDAQALSGLPEPQLQVVILHYWEQMSVADIAETLGVPVGTVKSRLHHARKNFKQLLGDEP